MTLKMCGRLGTLLLFLVLLPFDAAAQDCLQYEPAVVHLTGTISKKTFPGPPNYESIKGGDQRETYWVLHLARPVCTKVSGDNEAETGVTDVQLILTRKQYALYKKFAGRKDPLTIKGQLSHAMTGHHHTPVLMEVLSITEPQWEELKVIETP
jgi:hypothetical protein